MLLGQMREAVRWTGALLLAAALVGGLPLAQRATALPPEGGLPPAKQAIEDQYERERLAGQLNRAPKGQSNRAQYAVQMAAAAPERPTGILPEAQAPFSTQDVTIASAWQDVVDGAWVQVFAGAQADDPAQGIVIVLTEDGDGSTAAIERYPTPLRAGRVQIAAAAGGQLTLLGEQGESMTFDLAARAFE